jgi:hypothetical protein
MLIAVNRLEEGDLVDLENDPFADPNGTNELFAMELSEVCDIDNETPLCTVIYFDNFTCSFPPEHKVETVRGKGEHRQ